MNEATEVQQDFFARIWAGNAGLPFTFWVVLQAGNLLTGAVFQTVQYTSIASIVALGVCGYLVFAIVSAWRSAMSRDDGWAYTARVVVGLQGAFFALTFFAGMMGAV